MKVLNIDAQAILMDQCGAMPIMTAPGGHDGLLIELGGRRNKTRQRDIVQVLMTPAQGAEFVARIAQAAARFGDDAFKREFVAALEREKTQTRD